MRRLDLRSGTIRYCCHADAKQRRRTYVRVADIQHIIQRMLSSESEFASPWHDRGVTDAHGSQLLTRLTALRQHQRAGVRSPHKPLLVLLALGRLLETGSSAMPWSWAEQRLAALLTEFGPQRGLHQRRVPRIRSPIYVLTSCGSSTVMCRWTG